MFLPRRVHWDLLEELDVYNYSMSRTSMDKKRGEGEGLMEPLLENLFGQETHERIKRY